MSRTLCGARCMYPPSVFQPTGSTKGGFEKKKIKNKKIYILQKIKNRSKRRRGSLLVTQPDADARLPRRRAPLCSARIKTRRKVYMHFVAQFQLRAEFGKSRLAPKFTEFTRPRHS